MKHPLFTAWGINFFTLPSKNDVWYEGLLCKLHIEKDMPIKFEIYPVKQQNHSFQTVLLKNAEKNLVLYKIQELNSSITKEGHLQKKWEVLINEKQNIYMKYLSPVNSIRNKFIRAGINKLGLGTKLLSKKQSLLLLNIIKCESHNNLLSSSLIKQQRKY